MILCAITGGCLPGAHLTQRIECLVARAGAWAREGVALIQIREKDLDPSELLELATAVVEAVRAESDSTRVLLNGPAGIALAAGADGLHIPSHAPHDALDAARDAFHPRQPILSVACHDLASVARARAAAADYLLFAPVYGKQLPGGHTLPGTGLTALAQACRAAASIPVLALGGVTPANAAACVNAGAAGIAAIRLFMSDDWHALLRTSV